MAAAAFKANLIVRGSDGWRWSYPTTVSDVNAAYYVFPDGNNDVILPSNHGAITIIDLILSAAGTDTSQAKIYVNGVDSGQKVQNAANVGTVYNRQFMSAPLTVPAGARLRFEQAT